MTLVPLLLAAALSVGNAEFDSAAASGAFDIAVARESARIAAEGPSKGALKARMLADPGAYAALSQAKEKAKADYLALAEAELRTARERVAEKLGIRGPDVAAAGESRDLDAAFERCFAEERKAACDEQAKGIAAQVKPAEADFGRKDEAQIRAELVAAVVAQQRTPVFEENRQYVSETIVGPVMDSAKKELERQRNYLRRTRGEAYAPSVLAKELAENLAKNVRERNAKRVGEAIVWGVFPVVVESGAKEIAERRTLERVVSAVDDAELEIDAEFVRGRIAADPVRHRKADESEQLFRDDFTAVLAEKAVARAGADAPDAEREEFRAFVTAHAGDGSLGKAVESRVRRELLPRVRTVRGEIAAEDAKRLWPALTDGTWFPEPSLADDMCARSDYADAVKRWRDSPELVRFAMAEPGTVLLEETERLADGAVAKAFDLARSAINAQNAVLDKAAPGVFGDAKNMGSGWFARPPDYRKLVGMLTAAVEKGWNETREAVLWGNEPKPANAAEQHRELFPSVRKRIELVAKTILEELSEPEKKPEPEVPAPSDVPPEETSLSVSVKRTGDRLETKVLRGGEPLFERSCPADAGEFRAVADALTERLVEILELE